MSNSNIINCNTINYRQGFIEVTPLIHDKCINIEAWQIEPSINLKNINMNSKELKEHHFTGNTEIEMSIENAEILLNLLKIAINEIKNNKNA